MRREYGCDYRLRARVAYDAARHLEDVVHRLPHPVAGLGKRSVFCCRIGLGLRGANRPPPYSEVLAARREAHEEIRGRDLAQRINEQFVERMPSIRARLFRVDR